MPKIMDNGDSLLDVIDDTSDLFGNNSDGHGSLFNWADEFLGEDTDLSSSTVAMESGNLATNLNQSSLHLTTQNYAVTSSIPTQNITLSTTQFLPKSSAAVSQQKSAMVGQTLVTPAQPAGMTTQIVQQNNQQFLVRTPSGGSQVLSRQAQLQFQQQILQQQQQQQQQTSIRNNTLSQFLAQQSSSPSPTPTIMSRSITPNSSGGLTFGGTAVAVTHTTTQLRSSPAPNVNLVHLPPTVQQPQQHQAPQQQQFQIAPGTILQIPTAAGTSQSLVNTALLQQGQQTLLGSTQQGTLVNAQNTVIQNPNVVNVNVAAQHVLCSNAAQQPRTNIGLANIHTATPSPFNIQGTLIQTAEGKSILIPSQNIAQPINLQGLSVAMPVAQPQIQQPAQNTVSNILQLAQQQQHTGLGVDTRSTGNTGLQQIVLNHQGQQILVQRAPTSSGQPQNIIVRTAGGQSGIVQLQQRPAQPASLPVQQTLQALATGSSGQQVKIVNQQASSQHSVPVINIGGQNVTLQQLTNQLGNIQGLQLQQQQTNVQQQQQTSVQQQTHVQLQPQQQAQVQQLQPPQQQQTHQQQFDQQQQSQLQQQLQSQTQQQLQLQQLSQSQNLQQSQLPQQSQLQVQQQSQQNQLTFQGQQQGQRGLSTFSASQMNVHQHGQTNVIAQQNVGLNQSNTSVNSVENQTRLILQQIHNSLKKSQANAVSSVTATVSSIQDIQNKTSMNIKQEYTTSCSTPLSSHQSDKQLMSPVAIKTEPNLLETLIKHENNARSNCSSQGSGFHEVLTCTEQSTRVTTTVSQASTPMSLFVLSNSQNVQSNASVTASASARRASVPSLKSDVNNSTVFNSSLGTQPGMIDQLQHVQGTARLQPGMLSQPQYTVAPQPENQHQQVPGTAAHLSETVIQTQQVLGTAALLPETVIQTQQVLGTAALLPETVIQPQQVPGTAALLPETVIQSQQVPGTAALQPAMVNQPQQGQGTAASAPGTVNQQQGTATLQTIHLPPELQQQFQRVQLEMRKVQSAASLTTQQKQEKLLQLQIFQKRILLKGRVLSTTKAEPHQLKQSLATFTQAGLTASHSTAVSTAQSISSSLVQLKSSIQASSQSSSHQQQSSTSQFTPVQSNTGFKNLREDPPEQPDSTSSLGQGSSGNTLSSLLVSPSSSAIAINQLHTSSSSQSNPANHPYVSPNLRATTPSESPAPSTQTVASSLPSTVTTNASSDPQVAVPTQIKIADKVLTLSLTAAQKEKVQSYLDRMTPEQQVQYLHTQQHVLQRIQKQQALNAQIRAQVDAQKKQAAIAGQTSALPAGQGLATTIPASPQLSQNSESTSSDCIVPKLEVKSIPVPVTSINTQPADVQRGQKRSYMDIPKGTLINQQIRQDQNRATQPDMKRAFRSRGDACRRLLRYHVFQQYGPSHEEFQKFDSHMEDISQDLLKKKDRMFDRFRQLLFQETLRVQPSSELVMLQRMQNQELRKTLEEEKHQVKVDPDSFEPMPVKYLCKDEPGTDRDQDTSVKKEAKPELENDINNENEESEQPDPIKIKEEVIILDEDSPESNADEMRKLVIKTDGMNFSSSFKGMSMNGLESGYGGNDALMDDGETNDYENEHNRTALKHSELLNSLDDDDEDTNEYSSDKFESCHDEQDRAVIAMSSSDHSQDMEIDSNLDAYNVDNSLSQSTQDGRFFQNRRNFELASESVFYNDNELKKSKLSTKEFTNYSRHASSSVDDSKTSIPRAASSVLDNLTDTGDMDDSDSDDRFDMYQPITESLTDSEENSYYSADNAADQRSVMVDDDDDLSEGHWNKTNAQNIPVDSDQESDQEVKAQMESAINSILSLSQGASNNPDAVYSYSQSNQIYSHVSQSNSLYNKSNNLQAELRFPTDQSQTSMDVVAESDKPAGGDFSSDLDAAVNSILM